MIFLSYASDDLDRVTPLAQALIGQGWDVWWDRRIPPGSAFDDVIEEAIEAADAVVCVWTKNSITSRWVKNEANHGMDRNILVPISLDRDVKIPFAYASLQSADLTDWSPDTNHDGFNALTGALEELVGPEARALLPDASDEPAPTPPEPEPEARALPPDASDEPAPTPPEPEPEPAAPLGSEAEPEERPEEAPGGRRRMWLVGAAVVSVAVLIAGLVIVADSDEDGDGPVATEPAQDDTESGSEGLDSTEAGDEPATTSGGTGSDGTVPGVFEAIHLYVGQADAAVYRGACGEVGIVDAGHGTAAVDRIFDVLDGWGSPPIEWTVVSHYHSDSLGGVRQLVADPARRPATAYDRGGTRDAWDTETYRDYYDSVTDSADPIRDGVSVGETFELCEGTDDAVTFTVVAASDVDAGSDTELENNSGVCLHGEMGDYDFATCGDVGEPTELVAAPAIANVEFMKVNHSGSDTSTSQTWVDVLSPAAAVISVNQDLGGNPDQVVLDRLASAGIDVYQTGHKDTKTALDGDVTVTTDGVGSFTVTTSETGREVTYPLDEATVAGYAAATWQSFEDLVSAIGLPANHRGATITAGYTKPTDVAAYLWSTVAAAELGTITLREASDRIGVTLGTLTTIDKHGPSGLLYSAYNVVTGAALPEPGSGLLVSTADNAWLATSLIVVGNAFSEHDAAAQSILDKMNLGYLYSDADQLFHGGWWADLETPTVFMNELLNSETRIASYLAIARGEAPADHYYQLGRTLDLCDSLEMEPDGVIRTHLDVDVFEGHYTYRDPGSTPGWEPIELVPSWGGSMFEAMMPALFVPEEDWGPASWQITHPRYVMAQITHGMADAQYGYWGFSPSAEPGAVGYNYRAYGVDAIGMWADGYTSDDGDTLVDYGYATCPGRDEQSFPQPADYGNGVVTPHASFLALDFAPGLALDNLRRLQADFAVYGPGGFYAAVNVGTGEVAEFYLPLDQGMVMASIANFLLDDQLQAHFVTPRLESAVAPLLEAEQFWPQ